MNDILANVAAGLFVLCPLVLASILISTNASYKRPVLDAVQACEAELPRNKSCGWRIETYVKEEE